MPIVHRHRSGWLLALLVCTACAEFPELDRAVTPEGRAAPAPELSPIDPMIAPALESRSNTAPLREAGDDLRARAEGTRARSDALARSEGLSDAERAAAEARRAALVRQRAAAGGD